MKTSKITVIIPIYNVEKYIDRGLTNLLKQTYQDFEILLVDDGSTDSSPALCDAWAARYDQIRVFHKENGGSGSARNLGIENASGEYIYFFDIDDLADDALLECCVRTMDESEADMMVFSYRNKDVTTGQEYEIVMDDIRIYSNDELRSVYVDQFVMKMNGFPWNKLYRKSFLNEHHLRFEDLLIQQDEVFNLSLYPHVTKMIISSKVLYTYYIYNKGNTRSRFISERFDIYLTVNDRFRTLMEHWQLNDERLIKYMHRRLWVSTFEGLMQNVESDCCSWSSVEKNQELKRIVNDIKIQNAISYLYPTVGIEQRLYMKAAKARSFKILFMIYGFFNYLRRCKIKITK